MTITAKYPGTCPACGKGIVPGQEIEWEKGQKARHASCDAAPSTQATPARPAHLATGRQLAAIWKMLGALERVSMFDSVSGTGLHAAGDISRKIAKLGGRDKLTKKQASEILDDIGFLLDDAM